MAHADWTEHDKKEKELIGYMFGVEYGYHLGNDSQGTLIYADIEDLYNSGSSEYPNEGNFPQDGIVKVQIKFLKHVPAAECWAAKKKELVDAELKDKVLNRDGYIRIGDASVRADVLIDKLKSGGYLK